MRPPLHIRVPHLDDAANAELGHRVIWALSDENHLLHWLPDRYPLAIVDALDRFTAVTGRFDGTAR